MDVNAPNHGQENTEFRLQISRTDWTQARPFLAKLEKHGRLGEDEKEALFSALNAPRHLEPHTQMLAQGQRSDGLTIVLTGFACRFKMLRNGKRQITSYLVPGDICDFRFLANGRIDHGVTTLSAATISAIPLEKLVVICEAHPGITQALLRSAAVEEAIGREWLINLGQRTAVQRTAHMFCELYTRLRLVGLTNQMSYELPLTQAELGEALGLSTVHVNRTLQELRRANLISMKAGMVRIENMEELARTAMFDGSYLDPGGVVPEG